jgi:hypothetical protein
VIKICERGSGVQGNIRIARAFGGIHLILELIREKNCVWV